MNFPASAPLLPLVCYLLGGVMPGYWLVRLRTGGDIRDSGSGATGATNVGRVLGAWGFAAVLSLDLLKGALAVWLAHVFFSDFQWIAYVCGFSVVAGHIWPVFLGGRGGRGVATLIGVWLLLLPLALAFCLPVFACTWLLLRRFTVAGLCALSVLPAASWFASGHQPMPTLWAAACLCVILIAHREHLAKWLLAGRH